MQTLYQNVIENDCLGKPGKDAVQYMFAGYPGPPGKRGIPGPPGKIAFTPIF